MTQKQAARHCEERSEAKQSRKKNRKKNKKNLLDWVATPNPAGFAASQFAMTTKTNVLSGTECRWNLIFFNKSTSKKIIYKLPSKA